MLNFKRIELNDAEIFKKYVNLDAEYSCENAFVNLLMWQEKYNNMMAVDNGRIFIKSGEGSAEHFDLPFGSDMKAQLEEIFSYCGNKKPCFWVQEGKRLELFREYFGEEYDFYETDNHFDYIYSRESLASLAGKKYHSKRNHINAFSKKYDWVYKPITDENAQDVKICAEKWYQEKTAESDELFKYEKQGIYLMLSNMETLSVKGGAIYVGEEVVAFTLGTPLNNQVFTVHIEKALSQYDGAYAVINREFARNALREFEYVNREDDLGIEGLRRAKLSYNPQIILKKYYCCPKEKV